MTVHLSETGNMLAIIGQQPYIDLSYYFVNTLLP